MTNITITTQFEFTDEMVDQILVTAFDGSYGGSNYWAEVENIEMLKTGDKHWTTALIAEREDGQRHFVDKERLARGLKLYIERDMISESHLADTINSEATDFDANDADSIVQLSIFEEIRYG